jgi:hypothetical protein
MVRGWERQVEEHVNCRECGIYSDEEEAEDEKKEGGDEEEDDSDDDDDETLSLRLLPRTK